MRVATGEEMRIKLVGNGGKIKPDVLKAFGHLMRSFPNRVHAIHPRLISLLTRISDRFHGHRIEIISGFRPFSPTQYTPHSKHNAGHAIDFRVAGIPNEILRDYCKSFHNVGVGYYPNSVFVHLDVRPTSAFWIDYSHPGEPPRYHHTEKAPKSNETATDLEEAGSLANTIPPSQNPLDINHKIDSQAGFVPIPSATMTLPSPSLSPSSNNKLNFRPSSAFAPTHLTLNFSSEYE
ncbi:hypothetical protein BCY86_07910 [Pajaroellobacter abortibovis]|uniref:Murein endopeptidase K n=2 Tax=Pajaroellobacter abortibovis TaxID=1882918 RepID=A0A1L6MYH5_9BACT|nr:hypothetical protein BCY86_07910 [Pajaroellobacter abortibovis]